MLIKYIVLSDLHLGEEDSLFTPTEKGNHNLLQAFCASLQSLVDVNSNREKPTLILNGDILGLSFSTYQESLTVFDNFIESVVSTHNICDQIAYIPGNHDHHIWQLAMESQYRRSLESRSSKEPIPAMKRITSPLYREGIRSEFIEAFINKSNHSNLKLKILYPNMIIPPMENNHDYILIHHGHFAEKTYQFISESLQSLYPKESVPTSLNELEAENGAWINFAFSELGRSGAAGEKFEKLMNTLSSIEMFDSESGELSENVALALDYPYIPFHSAEKFLTRRLIQNIANKIRSERYQAETVCSVDAMNGLTEYLEDYCKKQMSVIGWNGEATTLIWSHTHKPFSRKTCTASWDQLKVINTGGWVLPKEQKLTHGGSITLINAYNEVVDLRIWNDDIIGGNMQFKVIPTEGESLSNFGQQIMKLLRREGQLNGPWKTFKAELKKEILNRRKKHQG